MTTSAGSVGNERQETRAEAPSRPGDAPPFRFYDNRQRYLAFVNTCNEKATVARRAARELGQLQPRPPAMRIFDAGMGDATVLSRLMGSAHRDFPTVPLLAVAKEISLEDVRLGLEKMPDRFYEHPHTVLVITNLSCMEAPQLTPKEGQPPVGRRDLLQALAAALGPTRTASPSRCRLMRTRCFSTGCTRCPRKSAIASGPRRCSRPGTRSSTSTRSKTNG